MSMGKKGVALGDLYSIILMLVLVGVLLGIGLTILGKLSTTSGISGDASQAINHTVTALADFASTWLGIIVLVIAAGIILTLLIGSFMGMGGQGRK